MVFEVLVQADEWPKCQSIEIVQLCEIIILQFSGTTISRRCIRVRFIDRQLALLGTVQGIILEALKSLQGFEKVVIEVAYPRTTEDEGSMDPIPLRAFFKATLQQSAEHNRDALRRWLEPSLGPATIGFLPRSGLRPQADYIQFHPRNHWATRMSLVKLSVTK